MDHSQTTGKGSFVTITWQNTQLIFNSPIKKQSSFNDILSGEDILAQSLDQLAKELFLVKHAYGFGEMTHHSSEASVASTGIESAGTSDCRSSGV
jgi:hypothetical protein